jgi:hypothetical protein
MTARLQDANAYILRLGDSGPAGLSQTEALDRLFSSAANGSELWFAINISNPGQLRNVSSRLIDDGWRFCASWNGVIRFVALARKVVTADDSQPVPANCAQEVWTKNGQIARARCWVQLDPESFRQVHWTRRDILAWQDAAWRPGFPNNQTSLLRGIVPVYELPLFRITPDKSASDRSTAALPINCSKTATVPRSDADYLRRVLRRIAARLPAPQLADIVVHRGEALFTERA